MTLRNDIRRPESSPHRVVLAFLARFLLRRRYLILSTIALVYLSTLAILADRQNLDVNNHQPNLYGQKRKNKEARIGGRSECTFCDGERGIPDLDLVLPQAGGNTCRSIKSMAAREMKGSDTCAILQKEERVCCPSPYSPPKTIFVISLQGTPGAHESNNGRLDLFKEKWRMACGSSSDSTNIEHCPAAVDKRRGYGLTLTWMMCLWRARQLDEEVAIFLEDDARLFANSTQEFCDVDKRGKLLSKLPSDTFVAWLGGHTWSYEDPISTAPYRRVRNSYGTYGFLVPRNSIDDFHAALKDGLINGSKDRKQNVHHNSLDPEPNFYRAAREHKKKMYAFNPLVIWHEGGYSNTWGKVRGDITGIETGRHGIKVGSGMANTNKRKRIDSNHQQEGHRSIPTISTKDRENAILGHRITPLDSTKKFSFVHIAKCAGATWMRLLKSVLKLDASPKKETGDEFSVFYHKNYCCKDADYTLISLRSPRHHVWSQFTMCKYSPWGLEITKGRTEFPRSGNEYEDDEVDFHSWLSHFVSMGNKTNDDLNCYHPLSMQTRALTSKVRYPFLPYFRGGGAELSPNMTLAMNTYKDLDFVALVEFVHESECMLYYRLGNKAPPVALSYLSQSCHCETQQVDHKDGNGIVNVQHHNMGKRTNLRDLPPATLSKVDNFISADSIVYVNALKHFMDEMAWLESNNALGRRVVCDDVLKKWEPELAYLDDGRFSVTQMYRAAITKIQQIDSKPECLFCDGERVIPDLDLVVPQTGGNTCRSIKKLADGEMRGSATCVILQKEERVCCPVVYEKALSLVEPISNQNDEQSKLLVPFKEGDHVVYDKRNELRLAEIVDVVNEKSKITLKYFKPHSSTASEETIEYREGLLHEHSEALRFQTGTFANCAFDYVENNTLHFTKPNDKSANVSCKRIRFAAEAGSFVGKSGVIVGVLSTSENFRWRNVIRSTWAAESTVFFVIAGSWDDIEEEYHRYKDIIWIDMEDSFRLITYKTSMFFQVVNMMASELNLTYSHALKTDDDSYVAIGRLEQLVKEEKPTTIDYWGYSQMKYVKPLRNLKSRYYVSLDQYPEPYYPPYVAGAAILLSHKTVECVTDEMQNARFLDMEDAFIGIVTARCGVIPTHSELVKVYRGSVGLSRWTTTGNKTLHVTMKGKIIQHRILNLEDMMAHHESIKTSLANTNESNRHRMWSGTFSSLVYISFFSTMCAFFFFLRQE